MANMLRDNSGVEELVVVQDYLAVVEPVLAVGIYAVIDKIVLRDTQRIIEPAMVPRVSTVKSATTKEAVSTSLSAVF